MKHQKEIGIDIILSKNIVFVKELGEFKKEDDVPDGMTILNISGTAQRELLKDNKDIIIL